MFANRLAAAAAVPLLGLLVACGSNVSSPSPAGPNRSDVLSPGSDPEALVRTWTVVSPTTSEGDMVIFGNRVDGGLDLFLDCGLMFGQWRANSHSMFVASEDGGDGACFSDGADDPWPGWLAAESYRFDGDDALLLAGDGTTLARLQPGGHPTTGPNDSPEFASPPAVTPDLRKSFAEPAPLPDDVRPASPTDVLGRWVPLPSDRPQQSRDTAFVSFDKDGVVKGSDGCNGTTGRYLIGPDGLVLATAGVSTAIGCDNSPLASWPSESGRIGLRRAHLVFLAPTGKILGEATRS